MQHYVHVTGWVIIATIFLLIGYDIYAKIKWGYEGTLSREILYASYAAPVVAFAAGFLCGHLFWPQLPPR